MTRDGYGLSSQGSFAYLDRGTYLSRTSPDSSALAAASPEDVYAAGLIDGEGCLSISLTRGYCSARIDVGMTLPAKSVLEWMESTYGGKVEMSRPATERWAEAWRWRLFGKAASRMAHRLEPLLTIKAPQAAALAALARVPTNSAEALELRRRVGEMNKKGPAQSAGWCWKRPQQSLLLESETYLETWPASGFMRNGMCWERSTLAPLIDASASGSWRTPRAAEAEHPGRQAPPRPGQTLGLTEQVAAAEREMFPTPAAKESGRVDLSNLVTADGEPVLNADGSVRWNERWYHQETGQIVQHGLNQYVGLWPTPHGFGEDNHGSELSQAVRVVEGMSDSERSARKVYPTPTTQDASDDGGPSQYQRNTVPLNALVKQDETLFETRAKNPDQLGLFPTPTAADATGSRATKGADRPDEGGLLHEVKKRERIPTPTAGDAKSSGSRNLEGSQAHPGVSLTDYVTTGDSSTPRRDLWPTPKSSPSGPDYAREGRESSGGDDLATAVARESFRTPQASDGKRNVSGPVDERTAKGQQIGLPDQVAQTGGQLNPAWVEALMGYPAGWTELP